MPKKCTFTLRVDQSRSKSIENVLFDYFLIIFFVFFDYLFFFTRCRFQNVPVRAPISKSTVFEICRKNVPFSCERKAYLSHFLPFSKCASIVLTQSYTLTSPKGRCSTDRGRAQGDTCLESNFIGGSISPPSYSDE